MKYYYSQIGCHLSQWYEWEFLIEWFPVRLYNFTIFSISFQILICKATAPHGLENDLSVEQTVNDEDEGPLLRAEDDEEVLCEEAILPKA